RESGRARQEKGGSLASARTQLAEVAIDRRFLARRVGEQRFPQTPGPHADLSVLEPKAIVRVGQPAPREAALGDEIEEPSQRRALAPAVADVMNADVEDVAAALERLRESARLI